MKPRKDAAVLRQLSTLFNVGAIRELTDGQLLERFSSGRGEAAELAFEALVERHGAMVMRVCRAQLINPHDTQDAFQATFLILIRKARGLWVRDSLGPWLHQVAVRTASCARATAARRRSHERRVAEMAVSVEEPQDRLGAEVEKVLHEEINRLPECYRVPIVLCDLEGYTCQEAARQMGRAVGTVKSWRFRGRERLRHRLTRRGLALGAGLGVALAVDDALTAVPKTTANGTFHVAARVLSQWLAAGEVPASVHNLVKGVFNTMLLGKLRTAAAAVFAIGLLSAGFGAVAWVVAEDSHTAVDEAKAASPSLIGQSRRTSLGLKESDELWPLTLREAFGIGLDNSKTVRLISFAGKGTPFKIAPRNDKIDAERFKFMAMAEVSTIEQQYWNLVQAHSQLLAAEQAVASAEEILKKEQAKLKVGRGTIAAVAEAAQVLEQLNLALVTRTSDLITTERMLRDLLGLPAADSRRIVPVTAPTEAKIEPDWEESRAAMLANHPDIARSQAIVTSAEGDVSPAGLARLKRSKAYHEEVIHQTTHSLKRFFWEIDANYKRFQAASRARVATAERLEAQRAYFEAGTISIDRFLDSVTMCANAVATEAQHKIAYNKSIAAFEEAKGTLLEHDQIAVAHAPKSATALAAAPGGEAMHEFFEPPIVTQPPTASMPAAQPPLQPAAPMAIPSMARLAGIEVQTKDSTTKDDSGGKTVSFEMTVKIGSQPVEIRGSFAITPVRSIDASKH
jgi:RNA polymerase sigma factor (sigma-70 family)